jgi:hypothetical protein
MMWANYYSLIGYGTVDNDEVPIPDGMGTSLQGANLQQLE